MVEQYHEYDYRGKGGARKLGPRRAASADVQRMFRKRAKAKPVYFVKISQMTLPKYLVNLQKANVDQDLIYALA